MTCHVSVRDGSSYVSVHNSSFYVWEECSRPDFCVVFFEHIIHDESSAAEMNSYPQKWVEELLGFTVQGGAVFYRDAEGRPHREDGPAVKHDEGTLMWYQRGEKHRVDGPAVERTDGRKEWWLNGERHRVDGPAEEYAEVSEWWVNGERHRVDGPAVMRADGSKEWWLHDVQVDEDTVVSRHKS